MQDLEAV